MTFTDKIKTLFTNKTDAFSILETYETQSEILRQAFLDKLEDRYLALYNREAVVTLIRRAMKMGQYEGVNLALSYCEHCGHEELNMDVCPKCGSKNLTKIDRMNGYLSYSRVKGDTRLNDAKMAEIADRKSM